MAIQVRRGNESDFNASKMLPGEWAVSLDTKYVRMCFAHGVVLRMATYEGFEADKAQIQAILAECRSIQSAVQRIQAEVNSKASLTIENANSAKESADKAYSEAERAKTYADNAEAVTGVSIATQDRAGLIKGGDNYIAEDGTLELIKETTSTTQPNSYAGRENILEIGGVTEQDSTAGNQLFKFADGLNTTVIGVTAKDNGDGTFSLKGTSTAEGGLFVLGNAYYGSDTVLTLKAGTYYVSGIPGNIGLFFYKTGSAVSAVTVNAPGRSFTLAEDTNFTSISLRWGNNVTFNESVVKIMLNVGTTALPWEPYTGGQPAPNPSYPMEIKKSVVSGVKTHGKNFVDINDKTFTSAGYYVLDATISLPKGTYTVHAKCDNVFDIATDFYLSNAEKQQVFRRAGDKLNKFVNGNYMTFTIDEDCHYITWYFNNTAGNTFTISDFSIMEGSTGTDYKPYTESSIAFSQPIELYGKDGLQDVITPKNVGSKYMSISISSEITVYINDDFTKDNTIAFYTSISHKAMPYSKVKALCSHFEHNASLSSADTECFRIGGNTLYFRVNKSRLSSLDVDGIKSFLAEIEPIKVVYELETETTEALPIADQIALNSLATYDGITYVEFDSEIQPTFKAEYGTSKVGGYTLEGLLAGRNGELKA